MKKAFKFLTVLVIMTVVFAAVSVPAMAKGFDFEKAVEEYDEYIQTLYFKIGETYTGNFSYYAEHDAVFYSSDESIAVIDEGGTITAKDGGQAYIAVVFPDDAYRMYIADVQVPKQQSNSTVSNDKYEQFQSNIQSAQDAMNDNAETRRRRSSNDFDDDEFDPMFVVAMFLAICFSILAIYSIISMLYLSKVSMSTKTIPVLRETVNTIKTSVPPLTNCPKCGREFDAAFCPTCGVARQPKNKLVVPINGKMTAQKFEKYINEWLAQNPYIYDCKISLDTKQSLLMPFVGYKFFVKNAVIEYSVAEHPQNRRYGFAFLYRFRLFGPIGYSTEKHVAQWLQKNPDCKVISHTGGRIQHFGNKSGFYAQYYNYVFFEK